jgi:serine/threonine-protein kinase
MQSALAGGPMIEGCARRAFAGRWTVECVLAASPCSAVYSATDERARRCALKVLSFARGDAASEERLLREIELTDAASCAGAPSLLGYGATDAGGGYLALELLAGSTLAEHSMARGGRFDLATALLLTERLLISAERLHQLGIVHRDIQPSNVFITSFGDVRLLDYSAAHASTDGCVDVAAIGAILYWLLSGSVPPMTANGCRNEELFIDDIAHLPCDVIDFIELAVARDSGQRPADASIMRMALSSMRDAFCGLERRA